MQKKNINFQSLYKRGGGLLHFPVWLKTGLKQTEKSCIASNYTQFSMNMGLTKLVLIL